MLELALNELTRIFLKVDRGTQRMTYKKSPVSAIDKSKINAAARKAHITADAHYFSWSVDRQELFRANMVDSARQKIRRVLLRELLGIQCTDAEVDDVWDDVPQSKLLILNSACLLTTGIGADYLYLNESMSADKTLLDFETLFEYDYAYYQFQEAARHKDLSDYKGADYYAYQYNSWVRLLVNDQLYYGTFISLAMHIRDRVEEAGDTCIEALIPHQYIEGKDDGKPTNGGFLLDLQLNANGFEGQLEELNSRWRNYLQDLWISLSKRFSEQEAAVYTEDQHWDDDPHKLFIFKNVATIKQLRWRHFLSDCQPLIQEHSSVQRHIEHEKEMAKVFLKQSHHSIIENFDPKVVKLRKKRKIIINPEALDDFSNLNDNDEPEE